MTPVLGGKGAEETRVLLVTAALIVADPNIPLAGAGSAPQTVIVILGPLKVERHTAAKGRIQAMQCVRRILCSARFKVSTNVI